MTSFYTINLDPGSDRGIEGIFLAFKDARSCTFIKEVKVAASFCPEVSLHLAHYPRTWVRENPELISGHCVPGAVSGKYSSKAHCLTEGNWETEASFSKFCECEVGKEPNKNMTQCNDCQPGYFKDTIGNTRCGICPRNSN